jgi:enamine deaminase RidA (YjgF/YER057c/UK114 family)
MRRQVVHPSGATAESGRWSHASYVDVPGVRLVFVAGQTARREDGSTVPRDDFANQFLLVYQNLAAVLAAAGATFADIVSMRTFLTRRADIPEFRRLRDQAHADRFPDGAYPPNTLVVVTGLAEPEMRLEVEAVAVVQQ